MDVIAYLMNNMV